MDPKEINQTSFCNKSVDNIVSNNLKKYIIDDMKLRTSLTPSSRYAKIFNNNYSKNFNNPHIFCLKSYGAPYLLFLTKINNVNYTLLIDKKIKTGHNYPKMFVVQYRFSDELFNGTLLETELLRDNNDNWTLLLGDIYYYNGKIMKNTNIVDRINIIHNLLEQEYNYDSFSDICPIQVKKYFDFKDTDTIFKDFIPNLNYDTRGFYFVPIKASYSRILYLFKEGDLEIKKEKKNTLNFQIQKTMKRDVYDLYLQGPNNIVKQGVACVPTMKTSQMLRELFEEEGSVHVECKYNEKFGKWEPLKKTMESVSSVEDV